MRILSLISALAIAAIPSFAQDRLQLEKPRNETQVHSPYGYAGVEFGSLTLLGDNELNNGRAGFSMGWVFLPLTALTFDADMSFPDGGYGMGVGVAQHLLPYAVSPFVEGAVGFRDPGGDDRKFGDRFGPTVGAAAGVHFFRLSDFQVRLRGGWEMIANQDKDQSIKADIALLLAIGRPGIKALQID